MQLQGFCRFRTRRPVNPDRLCRQVSNELAGVRASWQRGFASNGFYGEDVRDLINNSSCSAVSALIHPERGAAVRLSFMSTEFQSCPRCQSFILSDTFQCPECGHVFDQERAKAHAASQAAGDMKSHEMYDTCRECGESVRTGLVRCWNCNAFMRDDVAARYREMTSQPQPIIFSDIPAEMRTEFIPARDGEKAGYNPSAPVFDADDADTGFALDEETRPQAPTAAAPASPAAPPEAPKTETPPAAAAAAESKEPAAAKPAAPKPAAADTPPGESDGSDLLDIALQDQRETRRKKRDKLAAAKRQRILLPCACGAWIRVHNDQAGRTVRCRQCKTPIIVPHMKKKKAKDAAEKKAPQISVLWLDDVHMHVITPTDVVLKPGSLEKTFETVDVGFHESGVHLIKYAPPAKKSLFGKADGPPPIEEQRVRVREHIKKTGKITDIPFGDLHSISTEQVPGIRLVQPVSEAHASMFAGVPVFGEGQIAIYLPLELPDGQQSFLSFPLTVSRAGCGKLKSLFGHDLAPEQNGVPASEEHTTLKCHLSEMPVKSLQNVVYYENDPAFEVELAGYICETCGIAITEEARARKKLGGAAGKGIAKAKCPKCSNKFGSQKAVHLTKTPEDDAPQEEEDVSEVLRPAAAKTDSASGSALSLDSIQGRWNLISVGQNGNFSELTDMTSAKIVFAIEGDRYTVTGGDEVQEQGTIAVDGAKDPAHLDQNISEGPDKGKSHLGIFRLVDDRLEHVQAAVEQDRPVSFESQENSTASLAVFKRS